MKTSQKQDKDKERRKDERKRCIASVEYAVRDSNYTAFIQNISLGGSFIETETPIKIGETITMQIQFSENQRPITMIGEVVRISPQGFGIRFKMGIEASMIELLVKE